ncbi:MAG TPA: CDP-glycerol glycerophosphotransferase family protein [Methanobacterium sp.]|nr:CDP-glycerol glycerophosphotransferase family protein [Methanobacterium sp.]
MAKYQLFALFFNFYRLFKIKNNRVSLVGWREYNLNGNLGHIKSELEKKGSFHYNFIFKDEYTFNNMNSSYGFFKKVITLFRLFILKSYYMATSKYIFLSDNFLPLAYMNIPQKMFVIQLWHASGAFKKFGLSSVTENKLMEIAHKISKKTNLVVVSSKHVVPFYSEALGVDEKKVLDLGIPRTDFYFKNNDHDYINGLKKKFEGQYPELKGKKIVLYAPTFRDEPVIDRQILKNFNLDLFNSELGHEYGLIVRLHPLINQGDISENFINVTEYPDEKDLLLLADILITDYSSIMIEYALLNKPIIFYPYDYERYIQEDRSFYFDYMKNVPGPIACSGEELVNIIKENDFDFERIKKFAKLEFDHMDGKSTHRVINYILTNYL